MKTRKADQPYCGVNKKKIQEAKPILNETNFKYLHQFITRRYLIHKRKDVQQLPKPWTKDKILQEFKFTNVRREHDRETKWLLDNVVNHPEMDYDNKIMNIILYRLFNKSSTLELIYAAANGHTNLPIQFDSFNPSDQKNIRQGLYDKLEVDPTYTFFTNAFLTCGLKVSLGNRKETNDDFMPMRIVKFARVLYKSGIVEKIKRARNQKEVFDIVKSYHGLGEFLSYQIFVDFTYLQDFPFSENEFTVSGPGCIKGLKYIFSDFGGLTYDEALFWLRDNIDFEFSSRDFKWEPSKLFDDLPERDRYLNVMSLENCHCEISKYIRAVEGTGRPKNKYKGV